MSHPFEIILHSVHDNKANIAVGVFTTTELKLHSHLVTFVEKLFSSGALDVVVMLFRPDTEFYFLHFGRTFALGSLFELGLLILVFAVIHDATHRRIRIGCNLDKIKSNGLGLIKRFTC